MGRTHNQDYYKVGGGTAGSGTTGEGRFQQERAKVAGEQAKLRRDAPHLDKPQGKKEAPHHPRREGGQAASTGRIQAPRAQERRPAERTQKAKHPEPVAVVQPVHVDRPRHGKKRRSSKKRHDVAVLHEMEAQHVAMDEQRPPAPVADLRDRRLRRERPEDHGPSTLPPKTQGLMARGLELGRDAAMLVWELATAPVTVARLLARLREREA